MGADFRNSTPARLLRLWGAKAQLDLLWVTRNRRDCLIYYLSEGILGAAAVTATLLLAERFDGIGAWTKAQVLFMLGYAMTVTGLLEMLFSYNVLAISRRLGRGQLDHTLIQPQPLWMALLTEGFTPFSDSAGLVLGAGVLTWATAHLPLTLSAAWLALLVVNLLASAGVVLAFTYLWGSLAFWAPRAAEEISSSSLSLVSHLKGFPLDGAGPILAAGLMTVVPVGFVAWYPCRFLLGIDGSAWSRAVTPLAALLSGGLAALVFRKGLIAYGRTGSQRYLSFGHRR